MQESHIQFQANCTVLKYPFMWAISIWTSSLHKELVHFKAVTLPSPGPGR